MGEETTTQRRGFWAKSLNIKNHIKGRMRDAKSRASLRGANLTVLYRKKCANTLHDFLQRPLENVLAYNTAEAGHQIEGVSERSKSHRAI